MFKTFLLLVIVKERQHAGEEKKERTSGYEGKKEKG